MWHAEQFGEDQHGQGQREFPMQVDRFPALQRGRYAAQARCDDARDARSQVVDLANGEIAFIASVDASRLSDRLVAAGGK
ncbi:hypothetical protein JOH51_001658 [Rhizobium leguminosarum]|nr:hypothetical protein [Rhizobium leguminosarum]